MRIQKNSKILITGGCGFIGSNFLKELNKNQYNNITLCDFLNEKNIKNIVGQRFSDIVTPDDIFTKVDLKDFDLIIHMGANSKTSCNFNDAYNLNYNFSKRLFNGTTGKFVYASSASIYGNKVFSDNDDDFFNYHPKSNYSISKYLFDQYLIENNWFEKRSIVGCRIFNAFGMGESAKGSMASYIYQSFKYILDGNDEIFVYKINNSIPSRDFIFIDDILEKTFSLLDKNRSGIYNIGNGYSLNWDKYANIIAAKLSNLFKKDISVRTIEKDPRDINSFYQTHTCSDNTKINAAIGSKNKTFEEVKSDIENYLDWLYNNSSYYLD